MSNAYKTTTVPIARSQEAIRKLLINFGVRGVQFSENFESGDITIRFAKRINDNIRTVSVSMHIPDPPTPTQRRNSRNGKSTNERKEQMARATYRALHDWLKAQFVAVEFGLLTFEDVFLSHFEWMLPDGVVSTVGAMIKPRLETRSDFLIESGKSEPTLARPKDSDILEGQVKPAEEN